jgi:hypothetical protein
MIFAELLREGGDDGYYTLRYCVWNGDTLLGTYGVHYAPRGAYGASRDYHKLATEDEIAASKVWDAFQALPEAEQDAAYDARTDPPYPRTVDGCCYFDERPTVCDGSSLVEIITDDDQRAFEIAAMMADVSR